MYFRNLFSFLALASLPAFANVIELPGGSITIPGLSDTGISFTYTGTLTQADSIDLIQTGNPCLQTGPAYCVNGAGVITTAGSSPVGDATTFGSTVYGSILLEISGVGTEQIFPTNAANGLGSATPPLSLETAATLSSLGFGSFSVVNPTITFVMADTLYSDNSGAFVLDQAPEPSTLWLVAPGLLLGFIGYRRRARV
jgi:hypothetical protein